MDAWTLVIVVTVAFGASIHVGLLLVRGWLIVQLRKEQTKMRAEWERFQADMERKHREFEDSHHSPWVNRRTA